MKIFFKINNYTIATFGLFGFLFFHFAKEMLQEKLDGWYVGQVNLYGDLVFHLGFINKFLESGILLPESPVYAGSKPNYPIFADFLTAQIAKFTSIDFSLFATTFLAGILTIYVVRYFILNFIKNEKIVFIAFLLFFLNGGFGFYYFFNDFFTSQKSFVDFVISLPHEYTDLKSKGFWWINSYLAYFLPQRGFLFAFPITLTILNLLHVGFMKTKRHFFVLAGLLAGVLPLVQAHSLFVLFIVSACAAIFTTLTSKFKKEVIVNWIIFATLTIVVSLPLFNVISTETNPLKYIRFDPGWTSQENILWFWLKNLGLFGPILLVSLTWLYKKNRHFFLIYLPFLLMFLISNVFVFQPWDFDNSKLLIYWFFASTIIVAYFLNDQFFAENLSKKIIGVVFIFFMIFAGSLDVIRTFTPITSYQIFSNDDLEIAARVKMLTQKDSRFITASNHNHPIPALTGRSTILGFHGWVWSHGLDFQERASDVQKVYQGGNVAEDVIKKHKINFVTIGPLEKSTYSINESFFLKFPSIILGNDWILYDVSHLWTNSNRQN